MYADASRLVIPWRFAGGTLPIDLQTARIMFCCFSEARLDGSVMRVSPDILSTFCISSLEGRLSSDVPQKLCMGKLLKHLPSELVSQFSKELVLLTLP